MARQVNRQVKIDTINLSRLCDLVSSEPLAIKDITIIRSVMSATASATDVSI